MKIVVCSRAEIERLPPQEVPHLVISITTTEHDLARLPEDGYRLDTLRLSFPDIDEPLEGMTDDWLFSEAQARTIWDFVVNRSRRAQRVVVHCDAGISRSPAVAAALTEAIHGDPSELFYRYSPNDRVYRILMRIYDREFAGS